MAAEDADAAGAAPSDGVFADADEDVWFEVSPNTARVHLHAAPDGRSPLGLSVPVRALLARNEPAPVLEELVTAVRNRCTVPSEVCMICSTMMATGNPIVIQVNAGVL